MKKPFGNNTYCGPAVLSMVFHISTDDAAAHVRKITGKRFVKWMNHSHMAQALSANTIGDGKSYVVSPSRPTLKKVSDEHFKPSGYYVVLITGHFILVHNGIVYDNNYYHGDKVSTLYRRKVVRFWEVIMTKQGNYRINLERGK